MADEQSQDPDNDQEDNDTFKMPKSCRIDKYFKQSHKSLKFLFAKYRTQIKTTKPLNVTFDTEVAKSTFSSSVLEALKWKLSVKNDFGNNLKGKCKATVTPFTDQLGFFFYCNLKKKLQWRNSVFSWICEFNQKHQIKNKFEYLFNIGPSKINLHFEIENKNHQPILDGKFQSYYLIPQLSFKNTPTKPNSEETNTNKEVTKVEQYIEKTPYNYFKQHITAVRGSVSLKSNKSYKSELKLLTWTTLNNSDRVFSQNKIKCDKSKPVEYNGLLGYQTFDNLLTVNTEMYQYLNTENYKKAQLQREVLVFYFSLNLRQFLDVYQEARATKQCFKSRKSIIPTSKKPNSPQAISQL